MIFNVIDAMLWRAMHLLLLDLCNEMMQCYLSTCNGLMQNVLCIFHFPFFFGFFRIFSSLYWSKRTLFRKQNFIFSKWSTSFPFLFSIFKALELLFHEWSLALQRLIFLRVFHHCLSCSMFSGFMMPHFSELWPLLSFKNSH